MINFLGYPFRIIVCSMLSVPACTSAHLEGAEVAGETRHIKFSDPVDFIGVNFKAKRPLPNENFSIALLNSPADEGALRNDLYLLKIMPKDIPLRVVGFTDSKECSGRECHELSLRRAKGITDWLVGMGISSSRLSAPNGFGAERPIADNGTEDGRARNRRAYISYD